MKIAQSEIAGEALSRPHDEKSPSHHFAQAPALDDGFVCDETQLPYQVLRAHRRALTIPALPSRARNALASIALTVSKDHPLNSVFARRPYLAQRAGLSERTWYRAEQDLVKAGLIRVDDQIRKSRGGRFGAAYIYLTEATASLLGFFLPLQSRLANSAAAAATEPAQRCPAPSATTTPEAVQSCPPPAPGFFAPPTATVADRPIYRFYQSPLFQKRQPGELPEDVKPLLALGFQKNYIWALMKLCRTQHAKLLGDVVTVAEDLLRKATYPRSYLWTLIRSNTDFGHLARQQRDAAQAAERERTRQHQLADAQRRLAGRVFYDRDAAKRYEISSDGSLLTMQRAEEGVPRTSAHGWISSVADALIAQHIVPATEALDATFAELSMARVPRPRMHTVPLASVPRKLTGSAASHLAGIAALVGARRPAA